MQSINDIEQLSPEIVLKELAKAPESTFSDSIASENAYLSISLKVADAKFVADWDIKKRIGTGSDCTPILRIMNLSI